jgi:hypothetical protein
MSLFDPIFERSGFITLNAGESITINGSEGLIAINIFVLPDSTGNCNVSGSFGIGGKASSPIAIKPGFPSFTIQSDTYNSIDGVIISCATGCTAYISGKKVYK